METSTLAALKPLLQAQSEAQIDELFQQAYATRHGSVPAAQRDATAARWKCSAADAAALLESVRAVIRRALYGECQPSELFPAAFKLAPPIVKARGRSTEREKGKMRDAAARTHALHARTHALRTHAYAYARLQILQAHLPAWRQAALGEQPSLPRLLDVDWRVDIKSASEQIDRMAVPTLLVSMRVEDAPAATAAAASVGGAAGAAEADAAASGRVVAFELSKETLQAMLDGLTKIRSQVRVVRARVCDPPLLAAHNSLHRHS